MSNKTKSQKGSAAAIVIFLVLALAVVGAIAWVHYYYLPHMAAESPSTTQATSTSLTATSTLATSSATVNSTQTTTAVGSTAEPIVCVNNDLSCFISVAQKCSPSQVEWSMSLNLFGFIETTQSHLAVSGGSVGACLFSERLDGANVTIASATMAQAEAQGTTAAQIQQQIAQSNAQAQQSIGTVTKCIFTTSYLTQVLTKWSQGSGSSNDLPTSKCTTTESAANTAQAAKTTVYLRAGETIGLSGIEFKVGSLTASQLGVTITDMATSQSQAEVFAVGTPITVFGHVITLTAITEANGGEQATVTYN
jgi:hypothetical protein